MLQAVIRKGVVVAEQVAKPLVSKGCVLIQVYNSCISAGTEMTSVANSKKGLIQRALDQPENIKKVINMTRSEGLKKTINVLKNKMDEAAPTGYSISGIVVGVSNEITNFKIGDRVAAAGAGIANHAEYVDVPENLCVRIPEGLDFPEASTVTLGGIALQGVRRANLQLGENAVVVGAGILGLLSVQLLKASGVRVIVTDVESSRLNLASQFGADLVLNPNSCDIIQSAKNFTGGHGADAVIFTAATASNAPLSESFQMCKRKGRVIMIGVPGKEINRNDMYEKELDYLISTSYGPGRYDSNYEQKGLDYPFAYVRWTENRNLEEYLKLVSENKINIKKMISKTFPIENVTEAFNSLNNFSHEVNEKPLMVLLEYSADKKAEAHSNKIQINTPSLRKDLIKVGVIGAGAYATGVLMPLIQELKSKYQLHAVVSRDGFKAKQVGNKFNVAWSGTNPDDLFHDSDIDLVLISTRHDSHAELAIKALQNGKNVFVEKPLAINNEQIKKYEEFYESNKIKNQKAPMLFVGFNRRFSPFIKLAKSALEKRIGPVLIQYRMSSGFVPMQNWVHEHGGRIIGEACHNIDLVRYLIGHEASEIHSFSLDGNKSQYTSKDNKLISIKYNDGSVANIQYFSIGAQDLPKENIEIHFDGKSIVIDNFKSIKGYGIKLENLDSQISLKGQNEELIQLHSALTSGNWPIPFNELVETTKLSILANGSEGLNIDSN